MRKTHKIRWTWALAVVALGGFGMGGCGNESGASAGSGPGNDPDIGTIADKDAADKDAPTTDSVAQSGDTGSAAKDAASPAKDAGAAVDSGTTPVADTAQPAKDTTSSGGQDAGNHPDASKPVDAGPAQTGLKWFKTCGAPVCQGGPWQPTPGVPECTKGEKLGDPCQAANDKCDNKDGCKAFLICATKDPKQGPGDCPISRRSFKTDIQYLSAPDEGRYARQLQDLRLSTWVYRQGDGRKRLGIILEDSPGSVAVDDARDQVDLYSYISMAVAALKVQRREIEQLRRELQQLRGHADPSSLRCQ